MKANRHVQIMNYIMSLIEEHKYEENFKLPSESILATQFNTSRTAAKIALDKLEKRKYVCRIQGKGSFINTSYLRENTDLNPKTHFKVGFILPDPRSNFIGTLVNAACQYFIDNEIMCHVFYSCAKQEQEENLLKSLYAQHFDGIMIYPIDSDFINKELLQLTLHEYPIVLIDRYFKGIDIHTVSSNHFASSFSVTQNLFEMGRKNICFITEPPEIATSIEHRLSGFQAAIAKNPTLTKSHSACFLYSEDYENSESFENQLTNHFFQHPEIDAVITPSGFFALHTLSVIKKLKKRPGIDIELAFYDDEIQSLDSFIEFPYIQINQNAEIIGRTAAETIQSIWTKTPNISKIIQINPTFIYKNYNTDFLHKNN